MTGCDRPREITKRMKRENITQEKKRAMRRPSNSKGGMIKKNYDNKSSREEERPGARGRPRSDTTRPYQERLQGSSEITIQLIRAGLGEFLLFPLIIKITPVSPSSSSRFACSVHEQMALLWQTYGTGCLITQCHAITIQSD